MNTSVLRRLAAQFCGPEHLPRLWFFTDPERTPQPLQIAQALPVGAAVVYRHFGAIDRRSVARRLQRLCARRGLRLLIGADAELAVEIGAAGVHLPERMSASADAVKRMRLDWIVTAAAHSAAAMRQAQGADAIVLSPIYPSRSPSAGRALGVVRAARLREETSKPVIALGGVTSARINELARAGFAGVAGVDLFVD